MLEALAAALLVGVINTLGDYISVELKLEAKPIYVFARIALTCYCGGPIVVAERGGPGGRAAIVDNGEADCLQRHDLPAALGDRDLYRRTGRRQGGDD